MDQTACLVGEKDIDLMWLDDRCDLTASKDGMGHGLSLLVFSHSVIGRYILAPADRDRRFDAARESTGRFACLADSTGYDTFFRYRHDLMELLNVAC